MPGRTPTEAFAAFSEPLQTALACIASAKLTTSRGGRGDLHVEHVWTINRGEGVAVGPGLRLNATMRYEIVRTSAQAQPFKISTRAYLYAIEGGNQEEILCAHWHPDSSSPVNWPHWHIGVAALLPHGVLTPRAHLRSSRIAFEEMVRYAIELGAHPRYDDWEQRLEETRRNYEEHRSWG